MEKSMDSEKGQQLKEQIPEKPDETMVAENGWNVLSQTNGSEDNISKDKNVAVGETPFCWTSSPKCTINIKEFLKKAKSYAHLVIADGHLVKELKKVEKRIMSVFVVDKQAKFFAPLKIP